MSNIEFANKGFFLLFILLIPYIVWYIIRQKEANATIQVSNIEGFISLPKTYKHYLRHILFILKIFALSLLIISLARPQSSKNWANSITEGIDIVLAVDISSSMLAMDFKPNRLEASKDLAIEFISGRPNDRMGLVVFSGESFTQCPLTTDHAVLINLFNDIQSGMIEDGTAIGLGLATAVNRLKESTAISKVIILLTDGVNNRGEIDPATAAEIAQTYGIRVYIIGVGTMGEAPYPMTSPFGGTMIQNVPVEIDEAILQTIATTTSGVYFRATNNNKLREIYKQIDKLEKSKIDVQRYSKKNEEFIIFTLLAGLLLIFEIVLRNTVLRTIP